MIADGSRSTSATYAVTPGRSKGPAARAPTLPADQREEVPVQPRVRRQLGVERRGHQAALSGGDDGPVVERGHDLDARTDARDERRADEYRVERLGPDGRDGDVALERVDLA